MPPSHCSYRILEVPGEIEVLCREGILELLAEMSVGDEEGEGVHTQTKLGPWRNKEQALGVQIWQRPCPHHTRGLSLSSPSTDSDVRSMERAESAVRASRTSATSAWPAESR